MTLTEWMLLLVSRANLARARAEAETRRLRHEIARPPTVCGDGEIRGHASVFDGTSARRSGADASVEAGIALGSGMGIRWSPLEEGASAIARSDRFELTVDPLRGGDVSIRRWGWRVRQRAASGEWRAIAEGTSWISDEEARRMAEAVARVAMTAPRATDAEGSDGFFCHQL